MVRLHEAALQDPDGNLRAHLASFGNGMLVCCIAKRGLQ